MFLHTSWVSFESGEKTFCFGRRKKVLLFSAKALLSSAELEALNALLMPLRAHTTRARDGSHVLRERFFVLNERTLDYFIFFFLEQRTDIW